MNKVLLDSDIISFIMKNNENVVKKYNSYISKNNFVYISRISVIEILGGLKSKNAKKQIEQFKNFISNNHILDTDEASAELASEFYAELRKKGKHSGNYDIIIAGIAASNNLTLISNNIKDYENISGLRLENWTI